VAVLLKPVAGLSVAAVVAVVAVSTVSQTRVQPVGAPQMAASAAAVPSPAGSDPRIEQLASLPVLAPSVKVAAAPATGAEQPVQRLEVRRDTAAVRRKLDGYLVDHNQYAGSLQGIIPQLRAVATGAQN